MKRQAVQALFFGVRSFSVSDQKVRSVVYKEKIPNKVKYAFSLGAFGKDLMYGMASIFLMIYFTDVLKISPVFVGSMFFVARLWDAFNDLLMGVIVDNTRSKYGKFVPWLALAIPLNIIIFYVMFTDFHLNGLSLCVFATILYTLWGMCYTVMDVPYWSLIPNLTSDPKERNKISVLPAVFASVSKSLIINGLGFQIIRFFGGGYQGYHNFATIICLVFLVTFSICTFTLPRVQTTAKTAKKMNFKDVMNVIKQNDQLRWTIALILLYNVGIQFIRSVSTYYFAYVCCNKNMLSAFMISACFAEIFGLLVFPKISKKMSRKKVFFLSCVLPAFGLIMLLAVSFVCPNNFILTAISGAIVQAGTGLERGCTTVCLADVVDYGEHKLGTRNEGIVFSLQALSKKFTSALTSLSIGFALGLTGYIPNTVQTLGTKNAIRALMCIVPALGMLLAYVIYKTKYKLNGEFMKKIMDAISGTAFPVGSEAIVGGRNNINTTAISEESAPDVSSFNESLGNVSTAGTANEQEPTSENSDIL